MLLELARPVALLASMFSLLAVFHAAFLESEADFSERVWDSAGMLLLAAGVSLIAGLLFQVRAGRGAGRQGRIEALRDSQAGDIGLFETFPVRVFCWTAGILVVLFLLAWWVEVNCYFRPVIRF